MVRSWLNHGGRSKDSLEWCTLNSLNDGGRDSLIHSGIIFHSTCSRLSSQVIFSSCPLKFMPIFFLPLHWDHLFASTKGGERECKLVTSILYYELRFTYLSSSKRGRLLVQTLRRLIYTVSSCFNDDKHVTCNS
jgi:hypothetical protein